MDEQLGHMSISTSAHEAVLLMLLPPLYDYRTSDLRVGLVESMTPCRRRASSRHQLRWRVIRALAIALVMISEIAVTRAIVIPTTSSADK